MSTLFARTDVVGICSSCSREVRRIPAGDLTDLNGNYCWQGDGDGYVQHEIAERDLSTPEAVEDYLRIDDYINPPLEPPF